MQSKVLLCLWCQALIFDHKLADYCKMKTIMSERRHLVMWKPSGQLYLLVAVIQVKEVGEGVVVVVQLVVVLIILMWLAEEGCMEEEVQ